MVLDGILDKIGFDEEMKATYEMYKLRVGNRLDKVAKAYMDSEVVIDAVEAMFTNTETPSMHRYTLSLLFFIECTGYLYENYKKSGISDDIFYDTMSDIKCKLIECLNTYEIFGMCAHNWYDGFFKMTRFAFGRLQFDITKHSGETVKVSEREVNDGDFIVACHIPSTGPLLHSECIKAYKQVYDFVKDKIDDNILTVECHSWLLFPQYHDFFAKGSNTAEFINDYKVYGVYETDVFHDGWRIFGKEAESEVLPRKTSMQRKFADYIAPGKVYGYGKGIFLFDGEKVIK